MEAPLSPAPAIYPPSLLLRASRALLLIPPTSPSVRKTHPPLPPPSPSANPPCPTPCPDVSPRRTHPPLPRRFSAPSGSIAASSPLPLIVFRSSSYAAFSLYPSRARSRTRRFFSSAAAFPGGFLYFSDSRHRIYPIRPVSRYELTKEARNPISPITRESESVLRARVCTQVDPR